MTDGILAIDPGAMSGWAIYPAGAKKPSLWGQLRLRQKSGERSQKGARELRRIFVEEVVNADVKLLVIEGPYKIRVPKKAARSPMKSLQRKAVKESFEVGWKTYHGMGQTFGAWAQLAAEHGLKIVEVNPRTWQAKTVGTGPRKQQIAKYRDLAKHLTGEVVPADAAAAVVIGFYWMVAGAWKEAVEHQEKLGI